MAKILMATTEAVPFAKTGGLADVCGRLPIELTKLGHEVAVIMPAFRSVLRGEYDLELTGVEFEIPLGSHVIEGELLRGRLPGSDVPIYFVRNDDYFDRPHLYGEGGTDYRDNCQRFIYFARAVLESLRHLEFDVELIHCNDWQTGLIPVYLNAEYRSARGYEEMATMMTIHNMAYQGRFWHWDMLLTGLDWKYFNSRELEFYGDLNFLKAGIVFADAITTVSPRYSEEIQGPELGCGLEGVLRNRRSVLRGILNGVDYGVWNPRTDTFLPANYGPDNWRSGKAQCKAALQAHTGLKVDPQTPLLGFVGRLAEQKGATFIAEIMRKWASHDDTQWVILGTGDPEVERRLTEAAQLMPGRAVVQIDFNERLAHQIEAASDMFLMPSRYEPCGLNQMYSLKYGAV
ncbi:MAG: glycogen synthase, partial [Planctomycetales bacterium]|nr:glycogen synthase [Planctomycetales bacterium]